MISTRIALFGGAFDPPHIAHVEMAKYAFAHNNLSRILVVPTFNHPFSKNMAPFDHRLEMCKLAFEGISELEVLDIEKKLGEVSYTASTLRALKNIYPKADWSLILGSDAFEQFSTWKDVEYIRENSEVIVIPRGVNSPVANVSSTSAREAINSGAQISNLLPPKVAIYIETHKLY